VASSNPRQSLTGLALYHVFNKNDDFDKGDEN
jgi:hypothetical protein